MKSIIKRVMDGDWASLQADVEQIAAAKVKSLVDDKKVEVLAKLNGIEVESQREKMMTTESKVYSTTKTSIKSLVEKGKTLTEILKMTDAKENDKVKEVTDIVNKIKEEIKKEKESKKEKE